MKSLILLAGVLLIGAAAFGQTDGPPKVKLATNHGDIVIELDLVNAPITTASFLDNVDAGTYNGSIFHRVIPNFMVQGGGFLPGLEQIPTTKSLINEADNGLKNLRGTVAMARRGDPHSASIQFFISVADNDFLDHTEKTSRGWGYAVFGKVVEGMEVADKIANVPSGDAAGGHKNVPIDDVVVLSATRVEASAEEPGDG